MTRQELQERFEKAQANVAKRQATMDKIVKKIGQEVATKLEEIYNSATNWSERRGLVDFYLNSVLNRPVRVNDVWNDENYDFQDKANQYVDNITKMNELKQIENNWKVKLEERINKENAPKIQVLMDFLKRWRENAYNWYLKNCELYFELKDKWVVEEKRFEEQYKLDNPEAKWNEVYRATKRHREEFFQYVNQFTMLICNYNRTIDYDKLNKMLDAEVERKYEDLVNRVTAKAGIIQDCSMLSIGNQNGEINGFVKGDKRTVEVETISAGGYNIQCFHYRVLVK